MKIQHLTGEAEKRGGLREQALVRREDLSCSREEGRWRKEGTRVRRESSPRREGGGRRESSPRKENPVGRRENCSRHGSLASRTSQVLSPKIYS